jgi:phospholipase C
MLVGCAMQPTASRMAGLERIEHIIVIYAENRSFDNLYGLFPGANGIANATPAQHTQVDRDGKPLPHLPPVWKGNAPDPAFPTDLPNRPFRIDAPPINMALSVITRDLVHKFYPQQEQMNGGRNDRFAEVSDAGGLAMGYYDGSKLPMWKWAQEYTLADNFFMGAFGDSYLDHFWLVCACTPTDPEAPQASRAQLDERGWLKRKPESPASALDGPAVFVAGEFSAGAAATPRASPSGVRVCGLGPIRRLAGGIVAAPGAADVASRGATPPE